MTPYYQDESVTLHHGDALAVLRELPDRSVDCCVTSPPYFGLRDYGTAVWADADPDCAHQMGDKIAFVCVLCGGIRRDQQYGLEASPAEYVATMRAVFAEVRRVLADDGTLWLNIGDSYAGHNGGPSGSEYLLGEKFKQGTPKRTVPGAPKNLLGIPWRLAFALQDDDWVLRKDIIWHKPNAMPESVTDRPSSKKEYLFLLSKKPSYWFDLDAIKEPLLTTRATGHVFGGANKAQRMAESGSGLAQAGLPFGEVSA